MSILGGPLILLAIISVLPSVAFALAYRPKPKANDHSTPSGSYGSAAIVVLVISLTVALLIGYLPFLLVPLALIAVTTSCRRAGFTPRTARLCIMSTAVLLDLGFIGWWGGIVWRLNEQLQRHPVISLADRLVHERDVHFISDFDAVRSSWHMTADETDPSLVPLIESVESNNLKRLEDIVQDEFRSRETHRRMRIADSLESLHHSMESQFIRATGFGLIRIRDLPLWKARIEIPNSPILPLPKPSDQFHDPSSPSENPFAGVDLEPWHFKNLVNFASPRTFGAVGNDWQTKRFDLTRVVGFQPHAFGSHPEPPTGLSASSQRWRIEALSLVSLLKHRPAAAYVSENLPNMEELGTVPTRPLDDFEIQALDKLKAGRELIVGEGPAHIRMLGSLRAAIQCLECHQVKRGTLLGAFAYRFGRIDTPLSHNAQAAD